MTILALTEAAIRQQATAESFRRGQGYHRRGCVVRPGPPDVVLLIQRGHEIQAEVEGSQYEPYRVHVACDERGITTATCSCPYDWGGWCKHIVRRPSVNEKGRRASSLCC